jgi:hypothetical protein
MDAIDELPASFHSDNPAGKRDRRLLVIGAASAATACGCQPHSRRRTRPGPRRRRRLTGPGTTRAARGGADRHAIGRPGPADGPRPRPGGQPQGGLVLHVLELRQQHGLRLTVRERPAAAGPAFAGPAVADGCVCTCPAEALERIGGTPAERRWRSHRPGDLTHRALRRYRGGCRGLLLLRAWRRAPVTAPVAAQEAGVVRVVPEARTLEGATRGPRRRPRARSVPCGPPR